MISFGMSLLVQSSGSVWRRLRVIGIAFAWSFFIAHIARPIFSVMSTSTIDTYSTVGVQFSRDMESVVAFSPGCRILDPLFPDNCISQFNFTLKRCKCILSNRQTYPVMVIQMIQLPSSIQRELWMVFRCWGST